MITTTTHLHNIKQITQQKATLHNGTEVLMIVITDENDNDFEITTFSKERITIKDMGYLKE